MKIHGWMALILAAGLASVGCGGQSSQPVGSETKEGQQALTSVHASSTGDSPAEPVLAEVPEPPLEAIATPAEVVTFFLDALQGGNTSHVAAILTRKARLEMAREGYDVKADGFTNMEYEVGAVDYIGKRKEVAHVETNWKADEESQSDLPEFQAVWVLRKQEQGWRIAGVAYDVKGRETKEFVNFENPREGTQDEATSAIDVETASKSDASRPTTRQK